MKADDAKHLDDGTPLWPLDVFGLSKSNLKAKAKRHAVWEVPERDEVREILYEHRTEYTLDEIEAIAETIIFTSHHLAVLHHPDDFHHLAVRAAKQSRTQLRCVLNRIGGLRSVEAQHRYYHQRDELKNQGRV